jgi:tRNA (mo5U34)-methyltransferase
MEAGTPVESAGASGSNESSTEARQAVESHQLWYHTMEVAPGVVTPGWFDLRPIVDRLPWPDVRGKRCMDIGTWDGFLAFELERRGASEVVATDISDPSGWDLPLMTRLRGAEVLRQMAGEKTGEGFRIAKRLRGSSVERIEINIYDLTPERVGSFDVVVCGSLMLHLRDPIRALEAVRGICGGHFLSAETIRLWLTALHRKRPVAEMRGGENGQWWIANTAGHRRLVEAAGYSVERSVGPYAVPFGPGHPEGRRPLERRRERLLSRLMTGMTGVPHAAILARPRESSA